MAHPYPAESPTKEKILFDIQQAFKWLLCAAQNIKTSENVPIPKTLSVLGSHESTINHHSSI